nr:MAG TPA: hypothetical protein [Caudoviricetes sp.]
MVITSGYFTDRDGSFYSLFHRFNLHQNAK